MLTIDKKTLLKCSNILKCQLMKLIIYGEIQFIEDQQPVLRKTQEVESNNVDTRRLSNNMHVWGDSNEENRTRDNN